MYARQLGFASSWKMLTRDKGWIKPVLVLTLVGWIPILGQIAVLGYALEWARLTAWGVDAAPKQRGVAYGKVLATGGIAFLVSVTMGFVLMLVDMLLFGDWYSAALFPAGVNLFTGSLLDIMRRVSPLVVPVMLAFNLLAGTFCAAAMLRATLYDSFAAGWRLDRLFQMVARDVSGFLHLYAISLIGGAINVLYGLLVSLVASGIALGGVMGVAVELAVGPGSGIERLLFGLGPGIVVLTVVAFVLVTFAGSVVSTAMNLVCINAAGQWFCRFEVGRWGVSSAPLPDGVPQRDVSDISSAPPVPPAC